MKTFDKDPDSSKDYGFRWGTFLAGDTLDTSTWTVTGPDAALTTQNPAKTATDTVVWLSGGTLGKRYIVTNRVTTTGGRVEERSFVVYIKQQ